MGRFTNFENNVYINKMKQPKSRALKCEITIETHKQNVQQYNHISTGRTKSLSALKIPVLYEICLNRFISKLKEYSLR